MIQRIFTNMLEISITASAVIILVCLLSPVLEKKYSASWKYYACLGIAVRLLIPVSFSIPDAPIQIDTMQVFQEAERWQAPLPSEIVIKDEIQSPKGKRESSRSNISLLQISTVLWIVGASVFSVYHLLGYLSYLKNIKRWIIKADPEQEIIFTEIKADLSIKRKVSLYHCKIVKSPMMIGSIHPRVLIPCRKYSETDLYLILKHELMHYKRHDIEVKVLLFLVQTLYWFNPFVYLMSKRFNEAIEMCCDEQVVSGNDDIYKKRYMETILHSIKEQTVETRVFTTNYNGGMKVMRKRFENIIQSGRKKKGLASLTVFMAISLGASALVAGNSIGAAVNEKKAVQDTINTKTEEYKTDVQENVKTEEPKKLAENIIGVYAESERNEELEKTIINYLDIPKEYWARTKYYYNYVDLNVDGKDEIFVVVMGPYTSGTGGSTALHVIQTGSTGMQVNQKFTLIQTPIIISDKVTKGCKEIIFRNSGGGAAGNYVVLTASDGQYKTVNEGTVIKSLEGVSGTAIISNDIIKDMEEGKALYLQKD